MSQIKLFSLVALLVALLLSACGTNPSTGQVNPDGSVDVNVTLKEFTIESSITDFKPGVLYHFNVVNQGQVPHEFMIMPVSMDSMGMTDLSGMSMEAKDAMALMMIPEEQLSPGATASADYTFTRIPQGKIEIVCTLAGHYESGMHRAIVIQ